jgi:hypothetical protein
VLIDVYKSPGMSPKPHHLIAALHQGAEAVGMDSVMLPRVERRRGSWLVLYGLGGADRIAYAADPKVIAFDMGYWDRKGSRRKWRVSLGGFHCHPHVMRGPRPDASRWEESGLRIEQAGDQSGPIVLVGNGPKSTAIGAGGWTAAKSRELRAAYPSRRIVYRPKPGKPMEAGVKFDRADMGPIDDLLRRASLVVCRHSNVAVDACRLGVPVVCDDGAAAAIYPRSLGEADRQPDAATREEFLHRLAWWQWTTEECRSGEFWRWMRCVLGED